MYTTPHKHAPMAAPLLQSLIASSAACLEHCSAFSYTPHPFAALAAILRNLETALPLAAEIALYSGQPSPLPLFLSFFHPTR